MESAQGTSEFPRAVPSVGDLRSRLTLKLARAIFDEDPRGLIEAGIDGHVTGANEQAHKLFGIPDMSDDDMFWLLREQIADGDEIVDRFKRDGVVRAVHTTLTRNDGVSRRVEITLKSVDSGSLVLLVTDEDSQRSDALTGIGNRNEFNVRLSEELERLQRDQFESLSVLLIDVDYFKKVNDTFGHQAGDHVLCEIARAIALCVRRFDTVARIGGEEIAVLLPNANLEGAAALAERIRSRIEALRIEHHGRKIPVTASIGSATLSAQDLIMLEDGPRATPAEMIYARADAALYAAKHGGRNRVSVHA